MSNASKYTVGWICALNAEYVAAQEFLDEEHAPPDFVSPNDTNHYTLGAIGKHNVAIAVLPDGEYGTASAATGAANLLNSFPNVRIGLMVGIGGGAPSEKHDIRLGDIVVSATRAGEGGVIQYDFGKTIQNQAFQHTRVLNQPPTTLRTAMAGLQAQYKRKGHQLNAAIGGILERNVRLRQEFGRPPPSTDMLFKSDVSHDSRGCAKFCAQNNSNLVLRNERTERDDKPTIHYGLIASANQLLKDALIRDKLAAERDILCFEMEAAGLMNHFPCLVIRGICDYSDSHKSKMWQGYAALAAAAYAKDLLSQIQPNRVEAEKRIKDILYSALATIQSKLDRNDDQELWEWLAPVDPENTHIQASERLTPGTGRWFIDGDLQTWLQGGNYSAFLVLRAGVGKTTLLTHVVQELTLMCADDANKSLAYFYCTLGNASSQEPINVFGSLAAQLSVTMPQILDDIRPIFAKAKRKLYKRPMELPLLGQFIVRHSTGERLVLILVDAINETNKWKEVIRYLLLLSEGSKNIRVLLTTTEDTASLREICPDAQVVDMDPATVQRDIETYVHKYLEGDEVLSSIDRDLKADITRVLLSTAHGSFRWVQLSLENLRIQRTKHLMLQALRSLPGSLREIYENILDSIPPTDQKLVREALLWLGFAKRPLTPGELNEAVAFEESYTVLDDYNRLVSASLLPQICQGLIYLDKDELRLAHSSIREFLTSESTQISKVRYFALNPPTAHQTIMRKCLSYLLLDNFRCGCTTSSFVNWRRLQDDHPLLGYAACFWAVHATSYTIDDADRRLINQFFKTAKLLRGGNFGFWVQTLIPDVDPEVITATNPLYYAASFGLTPVVKAILDSVPDLEIDAPGGRCSSTPLFVACWRQQYEVAKLLLEAGANPNIVDPSTGYTEPVRRDHRAAFVKRRGNTDLVIRVETVFDFGEQK
ncbi:Ankyrin repeat-containing domain protein [Metarhizium guizhouense ARSEF 977]|uniref:Ankyrin repeat-containing domain protein n=1 Tax=Metarhizium guizhouense (strain ARSEF 977) TaxID=1276136 RepID=A0A0B4GKU8_METGA|nr:Ankyrin repeat-containing domain protein [Metarhizium guizhouense ARSEF 977]